jgi:hypothetical protein
VKSALVATVVPLMISMVPSQPVGSRAPHRIAFAVGQIGAVGSETDGASVVIQRWLSARASAATERVLHLEEPHVPERYRSIIDITAPTPGLRAGDVVHVGGLADERFRIATIEVAKRPFTSVDNVRWDRLAYLRTYFDCVEDRDNLLLYFVAARVLSTHTTDPRFLSGLWVRDTAGHLLWQYDSRRRAEGIVARFGRPQFANDIVALHALAEADPARVILARVMPFVSEHPEEAPVGSWGGFPLTIYDDGGTVNLFRSAAVSQ